jgi:hypothetical protein
MREETRRDTSNDLPLKWEFQRSDTSVMGTSPRDRASSNGWRRAAAAEFDVRSQVGSCVTADGPAERRSHRRPVQPSMVATHGRWQPASMVTIRRGSVGKTPSVGRPGPDADQSTGSSSRRPPGSTCPHETRHMPQYQFTSPIARASKFT